MKDVGPVIPIVTPTNSDGSPDLVALRSVCSEMLGVGIKGLFVSGTTGRGPWFNRQDREAVCRCAAEVSDGGFPVFAGVTSSGLPGMLENAKAMADSGANFVVATVPTYFHYNQQEIETIYSRFADKSPLPVMIYDIPEFTSVKLAEGMVIRLAEHGNVIGFKDSSTDLERFVHLEKILGNNKDFLLMQGKENLLARSLQIGASGFIVSLIHIDPRPFVNLYQAVKQGDMDLANKYQNAIEKLLSIVRGCIEARPESSTLFHMLNYALKKRGVCPNILLEHDGATPDWLIENTDKMIQLLDEAIQQVAIY